VSDTSVPKASWGAPRSLAPPSSVLPVASVCGGHPWFRGVLCVHGNPSSATPLK